jgi:hypothetical protein
MAKYKVIVLRVQGINKNTYVAGQIVSDENFPEGNAEKLCKEGKLELIESKADKAAKAKAEADAKKKAEKEVDEAAKAKAEADAKEQG